MDNNGVVGLSFIIPPFNCIIAVVVLVVARYWSRSWRRRSGSPLVFVIVSGSIRVLNGISSLGNGIFVAVIEDVDDVTGESASSTGFCIGAVITIVSASLTGVFANSVFIVSIGSSSGWVTSGTGTAGIIIGWNVSTISSISKV